MEGIIRYIENLNQNLVTIVSIITSTTFLATIVMRWLKKEINAVFVQLAKNFIIRSLSKLEEGHKLSEIEMEGLKDVYGEYVKRGGNTYVKERYEADKAKGLL